MTKRVSKEGSMVEEYLGGSLLISYGEERSGQGPASVCVYADGGGGGEVGWDVVFPDHFLNSSGSGNNQGLLQRNPFKILICSYEAQRVLTQQALWDTIWPSRSCR